MSTPDAIRDRLRAEDDPEAWLVLADWLIDQGDVRGTMLALERQMGPAEDDEARASLKATLDNLFRTNRDQFLAGWTIPPGAKLKWRHGYVRGISLRWNEGVPSLIEALLNHPVSWLLTGLDLSGGPVIPALGRSGPSAKRARVYCLAWTCGDAYIT